MPDASHEWHMRFCCSYIASCPMGLDSQIWTVALDFAACLQVGTVEQYLEKGPGFIFLFHPALGPMWDVVAQKIRGGAIMHGSELVLEVRLQSSIHNLQYQDS